MIKRALLALLIVTSLFACKKSNKPECTQQACFAQFVSIGAKFIGSNGQPVMIKEIKATNLRTKKPVTIPAYPSNIDVTGGFRAITSDETKSEFSNTGDDVEVIATTEAGQTKTVLFKISGGCNCHVEKISGPENVVFN